MVCVIVSPADGMGTILTLLDQSEDEVVLLFGLDRHEVHAVLPADVSRFQPIDFGRFVLLRVSAVEVIASLVRELLRSWKRKTRIILPIYATTVNSLRRCTIILCSTVCIIAHRFRRTHEIS